jgi:hypothetical protein
VRDFKRAYDGDKAEHEHGVTAALITGCLTSADVVKTGTEIAKRIIAVH